jgi:hypothetical protein
MDCVDTFLVGPHQNCLPVKQKPSFGPHPHPIDENKLPPSVGKNIFDSWVLQPSNNLNCLLHLIFQFRRKNCPCQGNSLCISQTWHLIYLWPAKGENPDFSSSVPLNRLNPPSSTASFTRGKSND